MDKVEDKTVRTGMPILFRVGNIFKGGYGREQPLSQGTRDKLVRPPDAFCGANLESSVISSVATGALRVRIVPRSQSLDHVELHTPSSSSST
jgi:hypothetical protein